MSTPETTGTPASILGSAPAASSEGTPAASPATSTPQTTDWRSSLPEDIRSDPSMKAIENVENLAKSYVNAQRMIGKDKIIVPNQNSTEQEWQQIFAKLGLPESTDKYDLKFAEGESETLTKEFKAIAHKLGVLPKQAQGLYDFINNKGKETQEQVKQKYEQVHKEVVSGLQKEWGEKYDMNLQKAQAAVAHYGGKELQEYLAQTGLGNDPKLIRVFAKVAETLKEGSFIGADANAMGQDVNEMKAEMNSIMGNMQGPYFNKTHPDHSRSVARMIELRTKLSKYS